MNSYTGRRFTKYEWFTYIIDILFFFSYYLHYLFVCVYDKSECDLLLRFILDYLEIFLMVYS